MGKIYHQMKEYLVGTPDTSTDLYNYYNLQYYGPIYMGDGRETIDVVWDTGSVIYLAETEACTECDQDKVYNTATSASYTDLDIPFTESYLDGTTLTGNFSYDNICVADDDSACVDSFLWVAISDS